MRKRNFKGRCTKRHLPKCKDICRTYDPIQEAYATKLSTSKDVETFRCNVLLEGLVEGDYTSDFVVTKDDGKLILLQIVLHLANCMLHYHDAIPLKVLIFWNQLQKKSLLKMKIF